MGQRIKDLQQESEIKDLTLKQRLLINVVLGAALVSIVIILLLAMRTYRQRQKLMMKENEVHQVRIAQLESEKQLLASEAIIRGQEEERGRLAKDLHDGLGGLLSGIKFSLTNMKSHVILDAENALVFERSLDMLDHSIAELRRVAHNMMPEVLVKFGLEEALKSYCDSIRQSGIYQIDFQSIGITVRLPISIEIILYRIVQELLNNIAKYAKATNVLVQLSRHDQEVSITVEDNGIGFDVATLEKSQGAGWVNIRSRIDYLKGKVDVKSAPSQGTSVYITLTV
jgi:signal transduction histidine kinase